MYNLSARHIDDTNEIVEKVLYDGSDDRPMKTADHVKALHARGISVLLIDEAYSDYQHYYAAALKDAIFVTGWNDPR